MLAARSFSSCWAQGRKVRVFTRDAAKVANLGNKVELILGDFTQPATFAQAVQGVEAVFMMNGALDGALFRQLMGIAKASGGPRVVFLSSLFAEDPELRIGQLHKDKENALRDSGLPYAIVRAGGFMSNTYQWLRDIRTEGVVYNPMGEGKVASIDPADIAAVAVHALTAPVLEETLFEVTGSELLTTADKARILSKYVGREVRVVDVSAEEAAKALQANGIPPHVAAAVSQSFENIRAGRATQRTGTVQRVTGRPPRTYEQWVKEHAARFA
jgi:uncharacterized protein YbjT (DUF2867 family)